MVHSTRVVVRAMMEIPPGGERNEMLVLANDETVKPSDPTALSLNEIG